jgi:hypothetical protein
VRERADDTAAAPAAAATVPKAPAPAAAEVLALQQSVGNRAVARMILARDDKTEVSQNVHEATTSADDVDWTAKFEVNFDDDNKTCWAKIRIQLVPDDGISKDDVEWVKIGVISRFSLLWDSRFSFHEHRTVWADRDWLFRPEIEFVDSASEAHEVVHLHPGHSGHSNRTNWYVMTPEWNADPSKAVPVEYGEVEHAHEVSHQMGLLDEYEDVSVPDRKTYDDHSLMGDYAHEGYHEVQLHPRHGERMAKIIGKATDKNLTSRMVRDN